MKYYTEINTSLDAMQAFNQTRANHEENESCMN